MKRDIKIDAVIGDLELMDYQIESSDYLMNVYHIFEKDSKIPGILIMESGCFLGMLSRKRFFEMMSKQFMFDLFLKRSVSDFLKESEVYLSLPHHTSVLDAASKALQREDSKRHDPLVVEFDNDEKRLLDFYDLLLAQTHVHQLTSNSLNEANEFKKELLGILAHDLRSPINSIIGFSQELKEADFLNEESRTYVKYIEIAARQMNDLMTDLLTSVLTDATEYELNQSEFELISLIESIIFSFRKYLESKQQAIKFLPVQNQIILRADRQKIKEVLENLISNAIKYSDCGKHILIAARCREKNAEITIQDEGQGFTKEDVSKLYRKFQRLSAKPTSFESSTGLGLYIVKKIVDSHDGEIILDTEINKGSIFKILLPLLGQQIVNGTKPIGTVRNN